jgi:deazaflavin-dependent oxidoreductase (nitroreductase family)
MLPPVRFSVDGAIGRAVLKVSGSRTFMRIGPKVVPHLDRFVHRVTGGRLVVSAGMLPTLVLTTTGARTGQRRTTPLATKPEGDHWYVVGSNFGRDNHPAWTANLIAHPDAEVSFEGRTTRVRAHLLTAEEKAELWPRLVQFWPNYDLYVERSGRDLRVFRLDPS